MIISENELQIRKERIIHTAYQLFCDSNIDAVSLETIAKQSDVAPNSIFRYFGSKAALVQCTQTVLWQEITTHILSESKEKIDLSKNGLEEMEALLSGFYLLYKNHRRYVLFASDYKQFLVRNHIKISESDNQEMLRPAYSACSVALVRGREDGSITKKEPIDVQFLGIWAVMRGFVEEIAVYDVIYSGVNPWRDKFDYVLKCTLKALENTR
ncbi:MAG: TetR/AcrR family transcriptional regulator [Anaerovoracaceae bacterium]